MSEALFIHVPKTGGTAVANSMRGNPVFSEQAALSHEKRPCFSEANATKIIRFSHCRPAFLVEHEVIGRDQLARWLTFAIMRNPWARLVSGYHAGIQHGSAANRAVYEDNGLGTFEKFARWVLDGEAPYPKRSVMKHGQWVFPQVLWYHVDGACVIDVLLKTESLLDGWSKLSKQLGVSPGLPPGTNASQHGPYQSYYGKQLATDVGEFYKADCEFGNYIF